MPVDHKVLDAFKQFDRDGSGTISREELGLVLQSINEDEWDSDRVDGLLSEADSSGDGKLSISEFLEWIFAENPKSIGLGVSSVGDFSFMISGCSRETINGVYVQQPKYCSHRPVFYCSANNHFLFYWVKRQQWQLHKRIGGKSCARLKTKGPPHMEAGWQVWKKKPHSLRSGFLEEADMTCSLPAPSTPEEQIAKAPKAVFVKEYGTFLKQEKLSGGRPLYYNETYQMWMLYVEDLKCWKLSFHEDGTGHEGQSQITKGYSPDATAWMDEGEIMDVYAFDPDAGLNSSVPEGWKDPSFPHSLESLGQRFEDEECEWVRALALSSSPKLFEKCEPADACQGQLGDAWLIAAIAAVAEFPNYIKDQIFMTKQASADGKYELQLFDCKSQAWKVIEVDDYLPCHPRKKTDPGQKLMFADLSDGEMWVPLLEKAFAKLFGSYEALHGGTVAMAFACLTGCTEVHRFGSYLSKGALTKGSGTIRWVVSSRDGLVVRSKSDTKSNKLGTLAHNAVFEELDRDCYRIMFKKIEGDGPESGWVSYYRAGKKVAERTTKPQWGSLTCAAGDSYKKENLQDMADMWPRLLEADVSNDLIVASFEFKSTDPHGRPRYGMRPDGLMPRHAYSVLQAVEIPGEVWEEPKRLVCLRNPWGRSEWKGPWKDQSDEWAAHPATQAVHSDKLDGVFWMAWDDFEWCTESVVIVPAKISVKRGAHEEEVDAGED